MAVFVKLKKMTKHIKPEKYIKDRGQSLELQSCYMNTDWKETGKATILIVKKIPRTNYIIGSFQIDLWCLGIKQTSWGYGINEKKLANIFSKLGEGKPFAASSFSLCSQIIKEANDFGISNGLTTPENFETSKYLIEENIENPIEIVFGKNGKPHYVKNEFNNNEQIISNLTKTLGAEGFTIE